MLRQTVVLQRRTAKLFNDTSKALHKRIHIFRLCLIHPHYVRCCFMAPIRPFISCRAQVPCVHKSFKTVSQLLENPYLYFCLANAGSPSQFACYPKAVRTGAPPKIKHRTPPPCVRPGSPPGLKFSLRPARPNGPFPGYVSKSVSFGIIHCLYLVGIWNSSQTIPVPCSSGAPSSRFDSLDTAANSPSTSSSVGMTRRISAAGSGLSVCA